MTLSTDEKIEFWCKELLGNAVFKAHLTFGSRKDLIDPSERLEDEILANSRFLKDLEDLCNRYEFCVEAPIYTELIELPSTDKQSSELRQKDEQLGKILQTGKLTSTTAIGALQFHTQIKKRIENSSRELSYIKKNNKSVTPPGPEGTPPVFAKMILIGISIFSSSKEEKEKFRTFLESPDGLQNKLSDSSFSRKIVNLLLQEGHKDLSNWRKSKKELFEKRLTNCRDICPIENAINYKNNLKIVQQYIIIEASNLQKKMTESLLLNQNAKICPSKNK